MNIRDCKEISRWAILAAALAFCAMGARPATSGPATQNGSVDAGETTVDGVRYELRQVPSNVPGVVHVQVTVDNPQDQGRNTTMTVALISGVYTGGGGGRVASAGDYVETIHDRKLARETIGGHTVRTYPAALRAKPVVGNPRWTAKLTVNGKDTVVIVLHRG